ncbi:MAG TPA: aspartate/glutamate racemase family protein [Devosia sp.]|nr:aspartate/glutamate racemase family protein [Devosia sp.]
MLNIHCLHSAQSNIAIFEAARRAQKLDDVMLKHRVRSDLLAAAEKAGEATPAIISNTVTELLALAKGAHGLLLTCSTLGAAAPPAEALTGLPVLRVDQALAVEAVRHGGRVIVLCAAGTTLGPTRHLFERAAVETGAAVEVRLVAGAWDLFRAGQEEAYWRLIAEAADAATDDGAAAVALAQASMAGATSFTVRRQPLTSPGAGLAAIVAAVRRTIPAS